MSFECWRMRSDRVASRCLRITFFSPGNWRRAHKYPPRWRRFATFATRPWKRRSNGSTDSMPTEAISLAGRKGLVVGIANADSLAWAAAQRYRAAGADLALTYLNDKAKPHVEPLAKEAGAELFLPCNVAVAGQLDAVFQGIEKR